MLPLCVLITNHIVVSGSALIEGVPVVPGGTRRGIPRLRGYWEVGPGGTGRSITRQRHHPVPRSVPPWPSIFPRSTTGTLSTTLDMTGSDREAKYRVESVRCFSGVV